MKKEITEKEQKQPIVFNRMAYGLFLVLVTYFLLTGDVENATINLGIALIFDPLDQQVIWSKRPLYQRVWLLLHLALTFAGFIYMIFW